MTPAKPPVTMNPVNSGHIAAIGYCPDTKRLHVQFKGKDAPGDTYEYGGVSEQKHVALMAADSHGKFFQEHVRAKHVGRKLECEGGK